MQLQPLLPAAADSAVYRFSHFDLDRRSSFVVGVDDDDVGQCGVGVVYVADPANQPNNPTVAPLADN
jgi:hypothetical protein